MARLRFRARRSTSSNTILLLALGAVTGLALGVVLADRTGGIDGMTARLRRPRRAPRDDADDVDALPLAAGADDDHEDHDDHDVDQPTAGFSAALPPDEDELESRVLEAFRNDPTLAVRAIDIGAIGDGIIELTGWVHSPEEVARALTLARGVPDVTHVMDRLTIRGTDYTRVGAASKDR